MPSTLERLFAYARTADSDPRENFTTEALAGAVRSDPRPLLHALASKGLLDIDDVVRSSPFTQVAFAGVGTIDLLLQLELVTGANRSELFRRRRLWAEASGRPWWILSAEYGLVGPDQVIAPYDTRIATLPLEARRLLAAGVADDLETHVGDLQGTSVELHAGEEYFLTVGPELLRRGARLTRPLKGLRIGEQLSWYGNQLGLESGVGQRRQTGPIVQVRSHRLGDGRGLSRAITELFVSGKLDLSRWPSPPKAGWNGMPEVVAAERLRALGASAAELRLFLTFNAAMDRARDADLLARRAVRMFEGARWTFQPSEIKQRSLLELSDRLRQYGVSQRHSADVFGWRVLGETLTDPLRAPESRMAIHEGHADALRLIEELRSTTAEGT